MRPRIERFSRASLEGFNAVFDSFEVVDGSKLPPLSRCGITLEGTGKSGKTTAIAGNQRAVIAKCYDGHPIAARSRAKMINCPDYQTFVKLQKDLRAMAKRQGKDSPYCMFVPDPLATVVRWLAQKHVEKHNKKWCMDNEGNIIPAKKGMVIESASEIEGYGPWSAIADEIERMFISFGELGWGWGAVIHYQWKAKGSFKGGMEWQPNLPATTVDRINKISDVQISTEREDDKFVIRYYSDMTRALGSRVPLTGCCEVPDYYAEDTPPGVTTWDYIEDDYEKACRDFTLDQTRFKEASKAIQEELRKGKDRK